MSDVVNKILGPELHGTAPPGLDELDQDALHHLAASVRGARQAQKEDLAQALEAALRHVPALLRGAVRKILLPGGAP